MCTAQAAVALPFQLGCCARRRSGGAEGCCAVLRCLLCFQVASMQGRVLKKLAGMLRLLCCTLQPHHALPAVPAVVAEGRGIVLDPHTVEARLVLHCVLCCAALLVFNSATACPLLSLSCPLLSRLPLLLPTVNLDVSSQKVRVPDGSLRRLKTRSNLAAGAAVYSNHHTLHTTLIPLQVRGADGSVRRLKTRNILVATGGRAVKPKLPGAVGGSIIE